MVMSGIVLDIIKSLLIAAVASWITVKLSLRKFYTEKWWERKAQAYSEIIGSLARMEIFFTNAGRNYLEVRR